VTNKYSILSSFHKSEKFIDSFFKTIFDQTYLPDEIIIIDDKNNGLDFENVINNKKKIYNFNNIFLIINNTNIGPTLSLNKGLLACKNNLVFRLDADDLWTPNHAQKMLTNYNKNSNFLIYGNSLRKKNILTYLKCDKYFINENHLIHSSWLINRNICPSFKYRMKRPSVALEDYFTILYYIRKNYKIFFSYDTTAIYTVNLNSHGRLNLFKKKYQSVKKKIHLYLLIFNLKNKTFMQKVYFILFEYNLLRMLIFILWVIDVFKIKKTFYYTKYFLLNKISKT
jgi:glycosyltransferase involved in cell wall biosynthesis